MKKAEITLYEFDELDETSKQSAIFEHLNFLDSEPEEFENEQGELVREYMEHTEEDTIESIRLNRYYFFSNGDIADCTTYTGKHPKAGKTEFKFKGENVEI